jgi:hypothetical protein
MRKGLLGFAVVVAALLLWLTWPWGKGDAPAVSATVSPLDKPRPELSDRAEIFRRAFWTKPTPEDKILHAWRREWKDGENLKRWQWFLVVEPSPALLKSLRDDNIFGLMPAASITPVEGAPEWFSFNPDGVSALKSPQGNLQLIFTPKYKTLYATDSGSGFRPGAAEPNKIPVAAQPHQSGRLPAVAPPKPE